MRESLARTHTHTAGGLAALKYGAKAANQQTGTPRALCHTRRRDRESISAWMRKPFKHNYDLNWHEVRVPPLLF